MISERELEFADIKYVAFVNAFGIDALSLVFNAVGGIEVLDVIGAAFVYNGAVFSRDIAVSDDEIGQL